MNRIWANRLAAFVASGGMEGQRWTSCPASRKAAVKLILQQDVADGALSPEAYQSITGEPYPER